MKEKICLYCKNFNFDMGSPGYSEYTPWLTPVSCLKGHWEMSNFGPREEFVKHMESAKSCTDLEEEK